MNQELNRSVRTTLPLQNGDRLTADEFEWRYEAMPHVKKAELINGVVYMPSPVSQGYHSNPHFNIVSWLGLYAFATPGVEGGDNGTLKLDRLNVPQPDAFLMILPANGGQAGLDEKRYVVGAPELVIEIAGSTASYDLHDKLDAYRRSGVKEYIVWRTFEAGLDWFALRAGTYVEMAPNATGVLESQTFPGLWLDWEALLSGHVTKVAEVAQQGIASPEHAAFVEELHRRAATS